MSKTPISKVTFFFILCSVYLVSFAHIGAFSYDQFFSKNERFSEGAKIAGVSVANASKEDAVEKLEEEIKKWKVNQKLTFSYLNQTFPVASRLFSFDVSASIEKEGETLLLNVKVDEGELSEFLSESGVDTSLINMEALSEVLKDKASELITEEEFIKVNQYLITSDSILTVAQAEVNSLTTTPGITNFIAVFPEIQIKGNSDFSLIQWMDQNGFTGATDSDLSIIASSIYKTILQTNFLVIERNYSRELPEGIELGFEANINRNSKRDFAFKNPNDTTYSIHLDLLQSKLSTSLNGLELPYEIEIELRNEQTFSPRIIKQYSPYLNSGEVKVVEVGNEGVLVEVWKRKVTSKGNLLEETKVSEDFYPPRHKEEIHRMKDYVINTSNDSGAPTTDGNGVPTYSIPNEDPLDPDEDQNESVPTQWSQPNDNNQSNDQTSQQPDSSDNLHPLDVKPEENMK
ncbi:VanW family protein [Rossellomorea aquimaris]|uniref:VanW family protein n=1 Tax=Rossellomorea aquimaris TaxID=189382 RepID=UPI0007D0485B|nr:VanW family protein [Rossellomorea aquimaris]